MTKSFISRLGYRIGITALASPLICKRVGTKQPLLIGKADRVYFQFRTSASWSSWYLAASLISRRFANLMDTPHTSSTLTTLGMAFCIFACTCESWLNYSLFVSCFFRSNQYMTAAAIGSHVDIRADFTWYPALVSPHALVNDTRWPIGMYCASGMSPQHTFWNCVRQRIQAMWTPDI
jgi:hypothetical protein